MHLKQESETYLEIYNTTQKLPVWPLFQISYRSIENLTNINFTCQNNAIL